VDQKAQALINEILSEKLPLTANLSKSLDLTQDEDYRNLLPGYQRQYEENLPESDLVASEIAYEYLLEVAKSIIKSLKKFVCHEDEHLEGLTDA
jgi:hypothetical protein